MADNTSPLLVPLAVEALIVNHWVQANITFSRGEMNYDNLSTYTSPAPAPFSNTGTLRPPGVHLHWALPRALTRGIQVQATATAQVSGGVLSNITLVNGGYGYALPPVVLISGGGGSGATASAIVTSGVVTSINLTSPGSGYTSPPRVTIAPSPLISFPFVPNRWLIVRYGPVPTPPTTPRPTKAWLLQSDSLDSPDSSESNSFVHPFLSTPEKIVTTRLGSKATVLESWEGEADSPQKLFLRAVGPGDATFAAYQPGVVNVFSFYDSIWDPNATYPSDQAGKDAERFDGNAAELTYLVAGWYSDATHDPLFGAITGWDANDDPIRSPWSGESDPTSAWATLINALNWSVEAQATATAQVTGGALTGVALAYGGSGYTDAAPPAVTLSAGDGSGASVSAVVAQGVVTGFTINAAGSGYTSPPRVTIAPSGVEAAELPSQSLYHALVYGVSWQTDEVPSSLDNMLKNMQVAVGNTSIDALAAIVAKQADTPQHGAREAELLEAFQYNFLQTLDEQDGTAQLDLQIRQAAFGSTPGGTLWQVVAAKTGETDTGQLDPAAVPPPPPLTPDQITKLGMLNENQSKLDEAVRLLTSIQWELYALWLKRQMLPHVKPADKKTIHHLAEVSDFIKQNLDPGNASGFYQQVIAQQTKVQQLALESNVPDDPTNPQSILDYATNTLGLDPTKLQLKAATMPRFYQPADPVVLVAGIETSEKQGSLNNDNPLPCRLTTQTVTGVTVSSVPVSVATSGMQQVVPATPANAKLPAAVTGGVAALNVETFFVDATNAATIVKVGLNSGDQPTIDALNKALEDKTAQYISTLAAPLNAGFAFAGWTEQPWSPLYMEWDVTFFPTVQSTPLANNLDFPFSPISFGAPPDNSPPSWVFSGTDFEWDGDRPPSTQDYTGRTFLTPQSTYVLIARLKKYLKEHPDPDLQAAEDLIDKIGDWNFLSQRLSGLIDQFIMRDISPSQPPDSSVAAQIGEQYHSVPDMIKGYQDTSFGTPPNPFFFPVRGGFFKFDRLTVVDAFGRVVDLMQAGGNMGQGLPFVPVRGRGMAPPSTTKLTQPAELVQLAPRLAQTSRLNFRFVSALDDSQPTDFFPDVSPVCGWVLPNHLDGGLAVYDADGNALGELLTLADTGSGQEVRWLPAPDIASAIPDPAKIPNQHLSKFVVAFTTSTDQGAGFANFLQAVDETLWTVDPLGSRADQNLSVLIGRPLALVRAELRFEFDGNPVSNQHWNATLQSAAADVDKIPFPVCLGSLLLYNDGLMGYYEDDTYTTFNSVHQPADLQPDTNVYLNPVGSNGNYLTLKFDNTTKNVTLLLDPRGDVHAFTGILPTKIVSLPGAYYEDALARMAVTFRTGPLLTDAEAIRIPYPTERHGTWSWIQRAAPLPANWTNADWVDPSGWEVEAIVKGDQQARLPTTPPRLLEGWLKLTPTDIEK